MGTHARADLVDARARSNLQERNTRCRLSSSPSPPSPRSRLRVARTRSPWISLPKTLIPKSAAEKAPSSSSTLPGVVKALAPAWKQLGEAFADNEGFVIGDVDCTKQESLCQKYGVQGYPTLKYFTGATSATGDAYQGGRDFEALQTWASENLGPSCGAENIDLCNEEQTKLIKEKQALTPDALAAEIDALDAEMKQAGDDLEALLKDLQSQYEAGKTKKDEVVAAVSPKIGLLRSVQRAAEAPKDEL